MRFNYLEKFEQLIRLGYCFLPELSCLKSKKYTDYLTQTTKQLYEEENRLHLEYLNDFEIIKVFMPLLSEFAKKHLMQQKSLSDVYKVTRVISSSEPQEAFRAHFDSHLFTLVTPINIPYDPLSAHNGELVLFNKIRREPSNEFENIYGKMKFRKYHGQKGSEILQNLAPYCTFNLRDNTPILFLGRQCLHFNLPLAASIKDARITFLTHFFDTSPAFSIGNLNRIFRNR